METKEKVEGFKFLAEYVGCDQDQINFGGNDDPQKLLNVGEIYKVKDEEIHSWYTKYELVGFPRLQFNNLSF